MAGKNCVAIAADRFESLKKNTADVFRRFGIQGQMVSCDFQKVFRLGEKLFVGLPGLATDVQTVYVTRLILLSYVLQGSEAPVSS